MCAGGGGCVGCICLRFESLFDVVRVDDMVCGFVFLVVVVLRMCSLFIPAMWSLAHRACTD